MACLEGRNFTTKLYPRTGEELTPVGGRVNSQVFSEFSGLDPSASPPDGQGQPGSEPEERFQKAGEPDFAEGIWGAGQ